MNDATATSRGEVVAPIAVGVSKPEPRGDDPLLALVLAVLVGAAVFALIWKVRRTFGMKE